MHIHLERHFPGVLHRLENLATRNKAFASLLEDYEEMRTWLAVHELQGPMDGGEIESARELIKDLENEIRQQLEMLTGPVP